MMKLTNKKKENENEFINKINKVYDECISYETYGSVTEFYDEDGIVLMTISEEENGKLLFSFSGQNDENFEYEQMDSSDEE